MICLRCSSHSDLVIILLPSSLPLSLHTLHLKHQHSLSIFYLLHVGSNPHIWFLTLYCLSASCWAQQSTIFILNVRLYFWLKKVYMYILLFTLLFYSFPPFFYQCAFMLSLALAHTPFPLPANIGKPHYLHKVRGKVGSHFRILSYRLHITWLM
jgi:hypothetical protein